MNCQSCQEEVLKSLDGLLTPDERARLDAHVAGCAACCREWEAQRTLARAAGRWVRPLPQDDPGEKFTADVLARIAARPASLPARTPVWLPLVATAMLLVLLALLPGLLLPGLDTVGVAARQTPGWLLSNLHGVPADASAIWAALTAGVPVPSWAWAALLGAVTVNAMFCVRARQAQRSLS